MSDPQITDRSLRSRARYRVGDLTIDVGTAEVRRDGRPVPLPRRSFDLLVALVEAAPNLLTVDELMERVWPGSVVNAETVSQRVKLLRVSLDDDPRHPRYVAVSRGRGYRIIPSVAALEPDASADASQSPADAPPAIAPIAIAPPPVAPPVPPEVPGTRRAAPSLPGPRWAWGAAAVLAAFASLAVTALYVERRQTAPAPAALPERSVAVLPFDNLGRSPQDAALAFGVAESLLHRLSASRELTVIARQSSFSVAPRGADVREIGRRLNARFLVEGSLQSTPVRLRITAQLIDAATGGHVWSLQFDRKPEDIFVIQDEIAARVADALRVSVMAPRVAANSGTQDYDAYLAHAQGRAHLATARLADARLAIGEFERAIQIDPGFARAYAGLAEATMFVADGEMSRARMANLRKAQDTARQLLERALAIDESDANTHLQLANLHWGDERAEKELMRALELDPNSAAGYRLLAQFRTFRDRLPDEAMAAIDRARLLSPLDLQYDNDKAMIALYGKFDVRLAEELSLAVLERDPTSATALWRLGEVNWCCRGEYARGVKYLEQALQRDPDHEFGRRMLMRAYLDLGDPDEARAIALDAPHRVDVRLVPELVYRGEWTAAAERTYEEETLGTAQAIEADLRVLAVRMHARQSGDYRRARRYLEPRAGVTWDADGAPLLGGTWIADFAIGLGDVLMQMGETARARRLLEATLHSIDDEARVRGRGDGWYMHALAVAYALLGRDEEALRTLERCVSGGQDAAILLYLEQDPAFRRFRSLPRFQAMIDRMREHRRVERLRLDEMRAARLVPRRDDRPPARDARAPAGVAGAS